MKSKKLILQVGEVVMEHDEEIEVMMLAIRYIIKDVRELQSKTKGI